MTAAELQQEVARAQRAADASPPDNGQRADADAWKRRAQAALRRHLDEAQGRTARPAPRPAAAAPAGGACLRRAAWIAAAAVVLLATSVLADRYGGDEIEHHRATAQAVAEAEADARFLSAEAAIEQAIVAAVGGRP